MTFSRFLSGCALTLLILSPRAAQSETPRPEYPRPQFERAEWLNLNGTWTYTFDFGSTGEGRGYTESTSFDGKITVPFAPESQLSGVAYTDFINTIWYQRSFTVPSSWQDKQIRLNFGAADYAASVYIDGNLVGRHYGSGSSFSFDITDFVRVGKPANLVVRVDDDLRGGHQTGGKQSTRYNSYGCMYTRTTGIWQTVWLEPVDRYALKQVTQLPDIDQSQLVLKPVFYNTSSDATLTVTLQDNGKTIARRTVACSNSSVIVLPVKNPKLWSPEDPFLYDLTYEVTDAEGNTLDRVTSYAGMRKVHTEGGYFYLNNKPYFQRLVLDQGFYPDGIWTAPSDEALRGDIELSLAAGFNGARLHQKVFEERYYYWADRLGYLTWGESASWGLNVNSELSARNFLSEWTEIVERDKNHPSLVTWTPFNETWSCQDGVYVRFASDVYDLTKALDPTRPVNDASGDGHVRTDIWSVHDYSRGYDQLVENLTIKPGVEPYRNQSNKKFLASFAGQPYMLDEFGGLPWIKPEERSSSWGYGENIDTLDEFYSILDSQIQAIKTCKYVTGFCYTQLTDVEQEKNGIYYYDRSAKFDIERIRAIFTQIPACIEKTEDLSDWR